MEESIQKIRYKFTSDGRQCKSAEIESSKTHYF